MRCGGEARCEGMEQRQDSEGARGQGSKGARDRIIHLLSEHSTIELDASQRLAGTSSRTAISADEPWREDACWRPEEGFRRAFLVTLALSSDIVSLSCARCQDLEHQVGHWLIIVYCRSSYTH